MEGLELFLTIWVSIILGLMAGYISWLIMRSYLVHRDLMKHLQICMEHMESHVQSWEDPGETESEYEKEVKP